MNVTKRDGSLQEVDVTKIYKAIKKAFEACNYPVDEDTVWEVVEEISLPDEIEVEEIQDQIEKVLMDFDFYEVAKQYIIYREHKRTKREAIAKLDKEIAGISEGTNIEAIDENSNKNAKLNATQRDLMLGTYSRGYALRNMLPDNLIEAHEKGWIHFHDLDYAITPRMFNCMLIDLDGMFTNGTCINGKHIETPHSINTACTVASQIVLQVSNNQYGGCTINIAHLSPYVRITKEKWIKKYTNELGSIISKELIENLAQKRTLEDVDSAIQTLQYQLNTFSSLNGQSPFVSVFMYLNDKPEYIKETAILIEAIIKLRIKGMQNEFGVWTTPAFPKLLFVLDENNVHPDSEYYYLKKDYAIACTIRRMNPDYISAKMMRKYYDGNVFGCMGCRSFLAPWKDENGEYKFWGRFNRGVVSLNLPSIALASNKDNELFNRILHDRLQLCKQGLQLRTSWLKGALSDVSPIHWQHGAIARLKSGESIDKYLTGGYSSISLGYIGLHETVMYMTGETLDQPKGHEFGLNLMKILHSVTNVWKKEGNGLDGCALYGTPSESLCYRFARTLKKEYGEVPGITDKQWITNSYHIDVEQPIDAFKKLEIEAEFQAESLGGAISYIELPNMENNPEAVEQLVDYMYDHLIYAEINTRSGDSCGTCGFTGEMATDENNEWYCPQCGERNHNKLTVVRRTCGYIGSNFWNKGKTEEISKRVMHL